MACFLCYLDPLSPHQKKSLSWTSSGKAFWICECPPESKSTSMLLVHASSEGSDKIDAYAHLIFCLLVDTSST